MERDQHLSAALAKASRKDLAPIVDLVVEKSSTFILDKKWRLAELREKLETELRENGGNSFANIVRGGGVTWSEVVRDVSSKVGVKYQKTDSTIDVEQKVALHVLERAVDEMTPEQKRELRENLERAGLPKDFPLGKGALVAGLAAGNIAGFAAYKILVIVANVVAKVIIGKGLTFAANAALTKILSIALGPVGWALSAVWTVVDIAGPAYRITIPSVVMVAVLRAQQQAKVRKPSTPRTRKRKA